MARYREIKDSVEQIFRAVDPTKEIDLCNLFLGYPGITTPAKLRAVVRYAEKRDLIPLTETRSHHTYFGEYMKLVGREGKDREYLERITKPSRPEIEGISITLEPPKILN